MFYLFLFFNEIDLDKHSTEIGIDCQSYCWISKGLLPSYFLLQQILLVIFMHPTLMLDQLDSTYQKLYGNTFTHELLDASFSEVALLWKEVRNQKREHLKMMIWFSKHKHDLGN